MPNKFFLISPYDIYLPPIFLVAPTRRLINKHKHGIPANLVLDLYLQSLVIKSTEHIG